MITKLDKNADRLARHARVRKKISGTPDAPRMDVYRSTVHIYVQVIDDTTGNTLVACSTVEKAIAELTGRKYAPLDKALKEYGTFGEIHNAYGYDYISEKRFRNLKKLYDERQNDPTGRLTADVLEFIDRRLNDLRGHLQIMERAQEQYQSELKNKN